MISRGDTHGIQAAVVMIGLGGTLLFNALDRYRRKLKIEDTGTIPIKSAPQGFVELQGYAWAQEGLILSSVLANSQAVYYSLLVEKKIQRRNSNQWEAVYKEQSFNGFLIVDSSGVALLNPVDADCDVTRNVKLLKNLSSGEQTRLLTHLASKNTVLHEGFFETYRVTECQILLGSPLCTTGFFRSTPEKEKIVPHSGLDKFLLKLSLSQKAPLWAMQHPLASALPVPAVAVGESVTFSRTESTFPCYGVVTSDLTANEKLFFADCHRGELITRLSAHLGGKIIGGSLLVTLGLVVILAHWFF